MLRVFLPNATFNLYVDDWNTMPKEPEKYHGRLSATQTGPVLEIPGLFEINLSTNQILKSKRPELQINTWRLILVQKKQLIFRAHLIELHDDTIHNYELIGRLRIRLTMGMPFYEI